MKIFYFLSLLTLTACVSVSPPEDWEAQFDGAAPSNSQYPAGAKVIRITPPPLVYVDTDGAMIKARKLAVSTCGGPYTELSAIHSSITIGELVFICD